MSSLVDGVEPPFIDLSLAHQELRPLLVTAFERVLDSGRYTSGREVATLEAGIAAYVGAARAVAVASGTAALHLALLAAGIGPGAEVILPPNTFFATVEAVLAVGARPVFADVDPDTAMIDPAAVEAAISDRTAAVIAVHLYGQPADMDRLRRIADTHRLFLLEDAAQAMGASWDGRPVGVLGDAAAFSFYPTKNLGGMGEGGAVTTSDEALARRVSMLRNHGESSKNVHLESGFNERLDEVRAAILSVKLQHFDQALRDRHRVDARYRELLADIEGVRLITTAPRARPAQHLLVVTVQARDDVLRTLRSAGVPAAVHYPTPVHLQPACRHLGVGRGEMPNAERLAASILSMPMYPGMTDDHIAANVAALGDAVAAQP